MSVLRSTLTAIVLMTAASGVYADTPSLSGSQAPAFSDAVENWLAGEDLAALQSLAAMSQDGNHAAQILLASIASRATLHEHVSAGLDRADRIALLRMPGGLSGKSWLTAAETAEPLATALLQASKIGEKAAAILALLEFGEPQTALLAAQSMLFNGEAAELVAILESVEPPLPDDADFMLAWAKFLVSQNAGQNNGSARAATSGIGQAEIGPKGLEWLGVSPRDVVDRAEGIDAVIAIYDQVDAWTPIRNFCDANCPDTEANCTVLGASLMALAGPLPMRSPLMSVIPNEIYWASDRITGDLARTFPDIADLNEPYFASFDACLMDTMKAAQAEHQTDE